MEKRKISKTDIIIIAAVLLAAAAVTLFGLMKRADKSSTPETAGEMFESEDLTEEERSQLDSVREFCAMKAGEYLAENPAESYLLITLDGGSSVPIPLAGDDTIVLEQDDGSSNTIRLGKNSFVMEASNCDNQNCIAQGEVTLENKDTRMLFDMILCLPHNLCLEMQTPEEALSSLTELYMQQIMFHLTGGDEGQ